MQAEPEAYEPAGQASQLDTSEAPALLVLVPAGHGEHEVEPGEDEYVPAGQSEHTEAPAAAEKLPGAQETQKPDATDAEPAAQPPGAHGCKKPVPAADESHVNATVTAELSTLE